MMITGCNSLISQQFGTHALHVLEAEAATPEGVGDADFVELRGLKAAGLSHLITDGSWMGERCIVSRPLFAQQKGTNKELPRASVIAWMKVEGVDCAQLDGDPFPTTMTYRGVVGAPATETAISDYWAKQLTDSKAVVFVHLGQEPMAWYWNLLLLVAGVLLAVIPEARQFKQRTA